MNRLLRRTLIACFSLLAVKCNSVQISDRTINIPVRGAEFYLNNPYPQKERAAFRYTFREYFGAWGRYDLGRASLNPYEPFLAEIHRREKGKIYVNIVIETENDLLDAGLLIANLLPPFAFLGFFNSHSVTISGEKLQE